MGEKTPEQKGKEFEDYVEKQIFISSYYERLKKTNAFTQNIEDHVRDNNNPDFQFSSRLTKKEYWVEAKYKGKRLAGKIIYWKTENELRQLERYRECNKATPPLRCICNAAATKVNTNFSSSFSLTKKKQKVKKVPICYAQAKLLRGLSGLRTALIDDFTA